MKQNKTNEVLIVSEIGKDFEYEEKRYRTLRKSIKTIHKFGLIKKYKQVGEA